jgi:alcohol dehydrogenase class IV
MPKCIIFGAGSIGQTADEAIRLGARRALVVIDPVIAKMGYAEKMGEILGGKGVQVKIFDQVEPEPSVEVANKVTEFVRSADFNLVVGIGGGSSLDMAKAAAIMATNEGSIEDYLGVGKVRSRLPLILLPTTGGTGSEVSVFLVFGRSDGVKDLVISPLLQPDVAIVDPVLSSTVPPRVTASTGFDALSHAVESMLSVDSNVITDCLNLEAIRLVGQHLRTAYYQGRNIEARMGMAMAATIAGITLSNTGAVMGHAIAMQLGSKLHKPHGEMCSLTLPYAMKYDMPIAEKKLAKISSALGIDTESLSDEEAAKKGIIYVKRMAEELDMKTNLQQLGVKKDEIEELVDQYLAGPAVELKWEPRDTNKSTLLQLYEDIWNGRLFN